MIPLLEKLRSHPILYVTRDIERALGLSLDTPGYFIIANYSPFANEVAKNHNNVLLIKEDSLLDTHELLEHTHTHAFIGKLPAPPFILVFKNTSQIERICADHNWKLLNPSAKLSQQVEEKISQITWLGDLARYLPPHEITTCKELTWNNEPYIVQFNHAHTGLGTLLISSATDLDLLITQFPNREVRKMKYIEGPVFTNNNVVAGDTILVGNINYQITGLSPFTDRPFSTIGNDWSLPHALLSKEQLQSYHDMVETIGTKLRTSGWKGLFGIDVIMDKKTNKLYLLEINARQPASTTYESYLQQHANSADGLTTFEGHLGALLDLTLQNTQLILIHDGAQILLRNQEKIIPEQSVEKIIPDIQALGYTVIRYNGSTPGTDLLRIQSAKGFMTQHNQLNQSGQTLQQRISAIM